MIICAIIIAVGFVVCVLMYVRALMEIRRLKADRVWHFTEMMQLRNRHRAAINAYNRVYADLKDSCEEAPELVERIRK
jgi:hypothetical protein